MAVGAVAYMVLMGRQGVLLIATGDPVAVGLGAAILVLPVLGLWLVWREIDFAARVQRLADRLAREGRLPPELPRRPSGRVTPEAAESEYDRCLALVADRPTDAAAWFALSWAYDAGRDRPRARAAMRHAVALAEGRDPGAPPKRLLVD